MKWNIEFPEIFNTWRFMQNFSQVSDILFILLCVPFTAADYYFTSVWPFGAVWCSSVQYLIIVTVLMSIYTLVLMSLDRSDRAAVTSDGSLRAG